MAVAYMISAEQCAIETVASMDISHSDICLNTPYFLLFVAPTPTTGTRLPAAACFREGSLVHRQGLVL